MQLKTVALHNLKLHVIYSAFSFKIHTIITFFRQKIHKIIPCGIIFEMTRESFPLRNSRQFYIFLCVCSLLKQEHLCHFFMHAVHYCTLIWCVCCFFYMSLERQDKNKINHIRCRSISKFIINVTSEREYIIFIAD